MAATVLRRPAAVDLRVFTCQYLRHNHHNAVPAEYTDTPKYPPIIDVSWEAKRRRKKEKWHDKVTELPTVEQKMVELNMPKFYGYWSCNLKDNFPRLLTANFCQFATRTHVDEGLPQQYYADVTEEAGKVAASVADQVAQLIDLNFNVNLNRRVKDRPAVQERRQTQNFLFGLHRVLSAALQETPHIRDAMVDLKPRIEAFWILGSIPPDEMMKKIRRNFKPNKHMENDPMDRPVQGRSSPFLGLRVEDGLPEVVSWDDPLVTSGQMPDNDLDPRAYGLKFRHKHATTVTGYWPGESREHGHLFLHTRDFMTQFVARFGTHNGLDAFTHKAVISSFTQALAHATYLGFGPVTELTYPVVQQSATTDGRIWNLSLYQLNTCALHSERSKMNPRNNILWLGQDELLFEEVDSGGVKGLNIPLLTSLIAMYLKKGVSRPDATPYLASTKYLSHHPASEEYREEFHNTFLTLSSNRPRHIPKPEMFLWEKIYKWDFKTRQLEPPRRFFEDHYNKKSPGMRRLDDYSPVYIPKALQKEKRVKYKPKLNSEHLFKYD